MAWSRVLRFADPLSCQAAVLSADVEILPTTREAFKVETTQVRADWLWTQHFRVSSRRSEIPTVGKVVIDERLRRKRVNGRSQRVAPTDH
jgi:hypothetical protein